MGYRKSRAADEDLIRFFIDGIGKFGVAQAEGYQQGLARIFELLAGNPRLGRRIERRDGYRRFHHGRHVIVYSIDDEDDIRIERILHDAMDVDRYL